MKTKNDKINLKNSNKKDNIKNKVFTIINSDISIKKDLSREIINIRGLANYILKTHKLDVSLDAIISAIRRYDIDSMKSDDKTSAFNLLKQARLSTKNKMSSVLLKRTDTVKTILGRPDKILDFQSHEIIRIIEGKETLTLIFDQSNYDKIVGLFPRKVLLKSTKKVGMIEICYPLILERTPGVFSIISGEFAQNDISIIDAVISSNEHIIVIDEKNLLKATEIVYSLCD